MKKAIIVLLLAVVLVSGCIDQRPVNTSDSNGLSINSFAASPVRAFSGELVLFDLEVENVGGTTARNVQADLFDVEGQWRDQMANPVDSTLTTWGSVTLKPPMSERNIPGDLRIAQWQLMTPDIPQGVQVNEPVEARVTFDYNTSGHFGVKMISQQAYRQMQLNKQDVTNPFTIVSSSGPLKLSVPERFTNAIILDDTNEGSEVIPFRIQIDNVGDGFPITPEDDGRIRGVGGKLEGTIDLFGPGVQFDDCLGVTSGTHIDLDDASILVRLREIGKGSVPIACNVRVDKSVWNNRAEDTMQFIFNLRYRYYVSKQVNVLVTGQ